MQLERKKIVLKQKEILHIEFLTNSSSYSTNAMTHVESTKEDANQKNILKFMHIFTNVKKSAKR
jgi:hypothetical protein